MKVDHMALNVANLEETKAFFTKYFGAQANDGYYNPTTGLRTYFLTFEDGFRLEIMNRPNMTPGTKAENHLTAGYIHLAFGVGSKEKVDSLTSELEGDGYTILSQPRTTGDGYYESCVLDSEGNQIEIVA